MNEGVFLVCRRDQFCVLGGHGHALFVFEPHMFWRVAEVGKIQLKWKANLKNLKATDHRLSQKKKQHFLLTIGIHLTTMKKGVLMLNGIEMEGQDFIVRKHEHFDLHCKPVVKRE